jgi:rare lipoprotein A (peptidoglycan hydrolase)
MHAGDLKMTRDRIVEISKKAARRVADQNTGTAAPSKKHIARLAELKKRRAQKEAEHEYPHALRA